MISKDEVIEIAKSCTSKPLMDFDPHEIVPFLERFANACYKRGIEDAIGYILNNYQDHNIASLVEAIRKLGEAE